MATINCLACAGMLEPAAAFGFFSVAVSVAVEVVLFFSVLSNAYLKR